MSSPSSSFSSLSILLTLSSIVHNCQCHKEYHQCRKYDECWKRDAKANIEMGATIEVKLDEKWIQHK